MKKHTYLAALIAAVTAPVVNTGLFLLGMRLFYYETMTSWANGQNLIYYMFFVLAGINFLIEVGVNLALSPAVARIVRQIRKEK